MPAPRHLDAIERFLAVRRLAMVGLSRDPKHFSVMLFKEDFTVAELFNMVRNNNEDNADPGGMEQCLV